MAVSSKIAELEAKLGKLLDEGGDELTQKVREFLQSNKENGLFVPALTAYTSLLHWRIQIERKELPPGSLEVYRGINRELLFILVESLLNGSHYLESLKGSLENLLMSLSPDKFSVPMDPANSLAYGGGGSESEGNPVDDLYKLYSSISTYLAALKGDERARNVLEAANGKILGEILKLTKDSPGEDLDPTDLLHNMLVNFAYMGSVQEVKLLELAALNPEIEGIARNLADRLEREHPELAEEIKGLLGLNIILGEGNELGEA